MPDPKMLFGMYKQHLDNQMDPYEAVENEEPKAPETQQHREAAAHALQMKASMRRKASAQFQAEVYAKNTGEKNQQGQSAEEAQEQAEQPQDQEDMGSY